MQTLFLEWGIPFMSIFNNGSGNLLFMRSPIYVQCSEVVQLEVSSLKTGMSSLNYIEMTLNPVHHLWALGIMWQNSKHIVLL